MMQLWEITEEEANEFKGFAVRRQTLLRELETLQFSEHAYVELVRTRISANGRFPGPRDALVVDFGLRVVGTFKSIVGLRETAEEASLAAAVFDLVRPDHEEIEKSAI